MKKTKPWCLFFGLLLFLAISANATAEVTLEVINPRGEIESPETVGISPRLSELSGKTIGLYDNGKEGFTEFLDVTEALIKENYPTATTKRYRGAFDLGDRLAAEIAGEVDAVIYGSGD